MDSGTRRRTQQADLCSKQVVPLSAGCNQNRQVVKAANWTDQSRGFMRSLVKGKIYRRQLSRGKQVSTFRICDYGRSEFDVVMCVFEVYPAGVKLLAVE